MMAAMDDTTQARIRWFHLTPGRFVIGLLAVEVLLWLSERIGWPGWHKGYAVLTGVASVGLAMLLVLGWFAVSLFFRWRFQFSIRLLLALVVVVAILCSWLAVEKEQARRQRLAVEAIRKVSGCADYSLRVDPSFTTVLTGETPRSRWPGNLLEPDFFSDVSGVTFRNKHITDVELVQLKEIRGLQWLDLACTNVTDAGLEPLRGLENAQAALARFRPGRG